ncbi:MAG: efflux RND transporter periplasmic adaptor subunit [Bacteroidia bacterium]
MKKINKILNNRVLQLGWVLIAGLFIGWLIFKTDKTSETQHYHDQGEEIIYTCSMHPQIRQNEPGNCPICGMDLIPLAQKSDTGESSRFIHIMSPEATALANVQTQQVKSISPEHEIYLTGKVAVNEQRLAVITANYSGRIEKLFVDFTGQTVSKGQKLATIYSPELVTAQKELIEAAKFKDINMPLYNAVKEKLRLWKITETQIKEIENSGVVLNELDVYADLSGIVISRDIAKGDYVNKGTVLFEIADLSKVWVFLDAYESDLPFIRIGQKITFTVTSVPGKEYTSSISFIDPLINPQTRTASVRVEVNNPQQTLKPEMYVKGRIKASLPVKEKSLAIPKTSLLWTGKRSVVYVKVPNSEFPAFEMREITLGASLSDYYIVESGLTENEEIVTNGVFAIDAAAQLSGNYSMMNRGTDEFIPVPDEFTVQLTDFVNQYFELKNSLVQSNFKSAQSHTKKLESALNKIDMSLLAEEAHSAWMNHIAELENYTGLILKAKDIEKQREGFAPLSRQLIKAVETFGLKHETVFVAYCPMAIDEKGAYWLSEFKEINNPYFGDKMLRCGEITGEIGMKGSQGSGTPQSQEHQH